jgi:ribosomal protein S18 acetylase RimI-like enzyme
MSKSRFMPHIEQLTSDDWLLLREVRLLALRDSPDSFLATYDREKDYGKDRWLAEFDRGDWHIGVVGLEAVSLLGVTREADTPPHQCYLEYLWVSQDHRRIGFASQMVTEVLERLRVSKITTAFLWVLDGNEAAMQLYRKLGFVHTGVRQPLQARPGRFEEKLRLDLP